ncbi:MAG: hypothetical protein ACI845_002200 [Gammaproteobacteria bacterium]|jgi:hypothetical protein
METHNKKSSTLSENIVSAKLFSPNKSKTSVSMFGVNTNNRRYNKNLNQTAALSSRSVNICGAVWLGERYTITKISIQKRGGNDDYEVHTHLLRRRW